TSRRLLYQGAAILAYTGVVALFMNSVCHTFWPDDPTPTTVFQDFIKAIIPTVCITLVYESVYFFEEWRNNVKKTESLARENVQSQLDALRNQLDPHFLFNSLNTLASLIDFENAEAQQYLERLSDVYRYVLVSRDKNTVTLEEEIAFLDAYVYLNKVRFRDNLQVVKEISPGAYRRQVAPLSLQMLVENAIKHNVVSKERPLQIRIVQEEETYLSVVNNVQEKTIFEKSTKVGLQNITNRYRLLSDRQVEVSRDHDVFKVRIPLLQPALS
ncbi:MAG TPA: histidine kinase, partial [Cytophagales bacterium]